MLLKKGIADKYAIPSLSYSRIYFVAVTKWMINAL